MKPYLLLSLFIFSFGRSQCDFNEDGDLDILDITTMVNCILDVCFDGSQCDANGDGELDILDIVTEVDCILSDCWEGDGICVDIDGNIYQTIQIGDRLWMSENLKVTHYNDGDSISYPNNDDFGSYEEGQYGVYDNDPSNADIYGNLYNWAAVDDERGVCPEGWHVPSDEEYTVLTDYLGGESVAGGKMKSTGTIEGGDGLWYYYSDEITEEATNESGFTGLPAGYRNYNNGYYYLMDSHGNFWSSTEGNSTTAWHRTLGYDMSTEHRSTDPKRNGFSIRCLGD